MKLFSISSLSLVCAVAAFGPSAFADKKASKDEITSCEANLAKEAKTAKADLHVTIHDVKNTDGHVLVAVYDDRCGGFPDKNDLTIFKTKLPATSKIEFVVEVPPGNYAIAILHDENDNGRMDKKMIFLPAEGYGFSNDSMGIAAPPSFNQAKVVVPASGKTTSIKMKYM